MEFRCSIKKCHIPYHLFIISITILLKTTLTLYKVWYLRINWNDSCFLLCGSITLQISGKRAMENFNAHLVFFAPYFVKVTCKWSILGFFATNSNNNTKNLKKGSILRQKWSYSTVLRELVFIVTAFTMIEWESHWWVWRKTPFVFVNPFDNGKARMSWTLQELE